MHPLTAGPPRTGRRHGQALFLGDRLDLREWRSPANFEHHPLVVEVGAEGRAVMFRFGVVVLFEVTPPEERAFLEELGPTIRNRFEVAERETIELEIGTERETVDLSGLVHLRDDSPERLSIVADALAKSVVLAHCEAQVASVIDRVEGTTRQLRETGRLPSDTRALIQQIAEVQLVELRTVGRAEVIDKPELLWERADLERLHSHLQEEFELRERQRVLDRKLDIIARAAESYLDLIQTRTGQRLEWSIVILIVMEICLTLYGMFVAGGH